MQKIALFKNGELVRELPRTGMFNESVNLGIAIVPVKEANTWLETMGMAGYTVGAV